MRISAVLSCLVAVAVASISSRAVAVVEQTPANVFNTRPYLWLEAENYASLGEDLDNNGWKVVSKESPITAVSGEPILPATSNVSGTALLDDVGGGGHTDTALYEMKFITAGTYQLFSRHSMYDSNANGNVGNEDSIYLSPAFNKNSASDWVGFEGLAFDESDITGNVDIPVAGLSVDPDGFKPLTADSTNDGWYALRDWGVTSLGVVNGSSAIASGLFNGNFNWYNRPFFVGANAGGGFNSDLEFKTEYIVTPEMVGQTLTFEMGTREPYGVMDGFLFIQTSNIYPDMDLLELYSQADLDAILPQPLDGDYNGNGSVDAADYVLWRDNPAGFGGDPAGYNTWRANFGAGAGSGIGLGAAGVPEPTSLALVMIGMMAVQATRRRGR